MFIYAYKTQHGKVCFFATDLWSEYAVDSVFIATLLSSVHSYILYIAFIISIVELS